MDECDEDSMRGVKEFLSHNRRKFLTGIGSLAAGGTAALVVDSSPGNIKETEEQICYQTVSPENRGEKITFDIKYEDGNNDVISSDLEYIGDATNQACINKEELDNRDYEVERVRIGEKTLYEP